ncbi:ABC transporter [Actinomadura sp. NBRC 104412]|uniref:ABC transporter permease n=1 Tax=Actinomadura sp. NBRC 104412 TaxID=3032203 RepID=UPI0024A4746E|nr:ABC transporter permease [Actinomadura sp. NBRC 104412]GLZ05241.1 ABC transporter [Actinomadura sp. NBRC 104412]
MARAVLMEWTKLRTVRSTGWLVLAAVVCTAGAGALVSWSADVRNCPADEPGCVQDVVRLSLAGVYLGQVAVVVLGVLAMSGEYGAGLVRTTLATCPRRRHVFAAKAAVVSALVLGAGLLGVLGSLLAARALLPGHGFVPSAGYPPLSPADEPTLRAYLGTVLYLWLVALLGLGVAAAVRHTPGALTAVLALLFTPATVVTLMNDPRWREWSEKLAPMTAGLKVQVTVGLDAQPIGPWAGLAVLAGYAGVALALGVTAFAVRDA